MAEFWLTDEQFAKIAPHLPTDNRGKERVDDRRVISGIWDWDCPGLVVLPQFAWKGRGDAAWIG